MKRISIPLLALILFITSCSSPADNTPIPPASQPATVPPSSPSSAILPGTFSPTDASTIPPLPPKEIWYPPLDSTFSWQLGNSDEINITYDVDIFDLDLFETDASTIASLHANGKKVICYISVGSWEDWRPDAGNFSSELIGNDYEGWPGENWLDITEIDLLAPIMRVRLDLCAAKGFDGIEPDNIDLHWADTGFSITYEDQIAYNLWLSEEAHARGLSIGLKNDDDQVEDLLDYFDWALTEDCFDGEWCEELLPFIEAGKPVFAAEYTDVIGYEEFKGDLCPQAKELGFYVFLKNRDLDEFREACP